MNQLQQGPLITAVGILVLGALVRLALHVGTRRKIHRIFAESGTRITRLRRFNGFLDLGSISRAITSTGYVVTVVASDGREAEMFCFVRYVPIVGLVRGIEVWSNEPNDV